MSRKPSSAQAYLHLSGSPKETSQEFQKSADKGSLKATWGGRVNGGSHAERETRMNKPSLNIPLKLSPANS